jgi:hydrogenase expression/formation protein HypE
VAYVPAQDADRVLEILQRFSLTDGAARIGTVLDGPEGLLTMRTPLGTERVIDMLSGEQLPRIC